MIGRERIIGECYTTDGSGRYAVAVVRHGLVYWSADCGKSWQRSAEAALSGGGAK